MSEVTKADIGEVHKRIDEIVKVNTKIQVSIARIETKVDHIPDMKRPCDFFENHIKDHKKIKGLWHNSAIHTAIDILKLAIVAAVTWLFATHDKN